MEIPQAYPAREGLKKAPTFSAHKPTPFARSAFPLCSKCQLSAHNVSLRQAKSREQAGVSKFSYSQDQTSPVLGFRPGIGQALLSKSLREDRLTG